jgi:hypothetical protein
MQKIVDYISSVIYSSLHIQCNEGINHLSAFNIKIQEITNNRKLSEMDVWEMAFYVVQTFERFALMNREGYKVAERKFCDEEIDTTALIFVHGCQEHIDFANVNVGKNLQLMLKFLQLGAGEKEFINENFIPLFSYAGGLNDFLYETLPQCLACDSLISVGSMDTYFDSSPLHYLFIHFFAKLKLVYGSLVAKDCPESRSIEDHLYRLGVDDDRFSFRELTLLSGYKTERAIRNLASPSTPEHKRIKIVKEGRKTFIEHDEVVRWLRANKKIS